MNLGVGLRSICIRPSLFPALRYFKYYPHNSPSQRAFQKGPLALFPPWSSVHGKIVVTHQLCLFTFCTSHEHASAPLWRHSCLFSLSCLCRRDRLGLDASPFEAFVWCFPCPHLLIVPINTGWAPRARVYFVYFFFFFLELRDFIWLLLTLLPCLSSLCLFSSFPSFHFVHFIHKNESSQWQEKKVTVG